MILHIIPDEKWTDLYIKKINKMFTNEQHIFLLFYKNTIRYCDESYIVGVSNVFKVEGHIIFNKRVKIYIKKSRKIILHSLFFPIEDIMFLSRIKNKHIVWFVWGGDLYDIYLDYKKAPFNIKYIVREHFRRHLILNLDVAIANDGDYNLLCSWYKTNARQIFAQYAYTLIDSSSLSAYKHNNKIRIMVGHSATKTCEHIKVFNRLKNYRGEIEIVSPLSYGEDKNYKEYVIETGRELFGDDFYPITDYMDYEEYNNMLNSIDIGIFANNRQQGNGNIVSMLFLGKKIYISPENNLYHLYKNLGAKLYVYPNEIDEMFLSPLNEDDMKKNMKLIINQFSDQTFFKAWSEVFSF